MGRKANPNPMHVATWTPRVAPALATSPAPAGNGGAIGRAISAGQARRAGMSLRPSAIWRGE